MKLAGAVLLLAWVLVFSRTEGLVSLMTGATVYALMRGFPKERDL